MRNRSLIIVLAILLQGCDPAKTLVIEAGSKGDSVKVIANEKLLPFNNNNEGKIVITVPSGDTMRKVFHYEMGGWSDKALIDLASKIDSIHIENGSGKISISDPDKIVAYLKNHQSGWAGSILTISTK